MEKCRRCGNDVDGVDIYAKSSIAPDPCPKCRDWLKTLKEGDRLIVIKDDIPYSCVITDISEHNIITELTDADLPLVLIEVYDRKLYFSRSNGRNIGYQLVPETSELRGQIITRTIKNKIKERLDKEEPKTLGDLLKILQRYSKFLEKIS